MENPYVSSNSNAVLHETTSAENSVIAMLQMQLAEARKAAVVANAAKEKAIAVLEDQRRQIELAEATRQLHDAQARSQAVKAITEVQNRAEQRVLHTQQMAEAQIEAPITRLMD